MALLVPDHLYAGSGALEPMSTQIRIATSNDVPELLQLACEFVEDGRREMIWGPRTAALYDGIFSRLTSGRQAGAAVLAPGAGFACAIEVPHETPWGRVATGFGIFVRPAHRGSGIGRALHEALCLALRAWGFAGLITGSDTQAGAAILSALEPISSYGLIRFDSSSSEEEGA